MKAKYVARNLIDIIKTHTFLYKEFGVDNEAREYAIIYINCILNNFIDSIEDKYYYEEIKKQIYLV